MPGEDLWVGVLGPLLVTRDRTVVRVPRARSAVLLAVLAMSAGQPVGVGRLAELIWPEEQPEWVRPSIHSLVARVRGLVPGVVVTAADGYLLDVDPDHVDLLRYRRLVRAAHGTTDPGTAAGLLDQALGLWRGEPLSDLRSSALHREAVPGLVEEHLLAVQRRGELDLAAGRYNRVIAELGTLTGQYELRESLWAQLIRALAAAGRPAEAIQQYHRVRKILAEELGVDPAAELQDLYQQLLRAKDRDVPRAQPSAGYARPVPYQLPADTRVFTGRQAEVARLLDLGRAPDAGMVVISAIDGMAGIGKTALAIHAAHRLAEWFTDGQLFVDLHGHTQGYPPRTADQALEMLLRALDVPARQIPDDGEERAALYRERLAGTRTLIVLDNAADEAQVWPLIPGEGGCLVLVTSRRKLKALDDAYAVALDVLPEADAIGLFCTLAGPGRAAADDPAVTEIIGLCGGLPLTVRIAAALLRNRPAWNPRHLVHRLRAASTRLDVLFDGDRDVAALFGLSSQHLHDDQARLYRYLSLIPGPDIDGYAAAALLGTDLATAERLLQALVDHNLVLEVTAGRYSMHDLIRAHARALSASAAPARAALDRLLDYYQLTTSQAGVTRAWLRAERANLTACLEYAIEHGLDERVVAFSAGLAALLRTDGPWPQAAAMHTASAAAAARLGDRSAQADALTELGTVRKLTGHYPVAGNSLHEALNLYRADGDKPGQARALTELGIVQRMTDVHPGSARSMRAALALYRETGDKPGQASALTGLGSVRYMSGDYPGAKRSLRAALALHREADDKFGQAHALTQLIEVQTLTGDYQDAIRNGEAALVIAAELGDRLRQASTLSVLGRVQRLTGDWAGAARSQETALVIARELGNRIGQANVLAELGAARLSAGDCSGAARDLEESLGIYQDLGSRGGRALALNYYATVISATGDLTRAIAVYREALQLAREVHHPDDEAAALHGLGDSYLRTGQVQDGASCLGQALEIYQRLGMPAAGQVIARLAEASAGQADRRACPVRHAH